MKYASIALALGCFAFGCSSSSSTTPGATGGDGGTGDDGSVSDTSAPLGSFTVQFGPITVAPGTENTQCVVKRLGNPNALHVGQFHNQLGDSSHHLIVYRVSDTVEQTTPFDCKPFTDTLDPSKGSTLMITQKKDEVLTLPAGVAYTLDPNQMIRLEMHYINATKVEKTLVSTSTMIPIADADFKNEAGFLFIGNPDISIPAGAKATVGPSFFKVPTDYADAKFFAITGHEHQYGTNVTVRTAANATDPGTAVYDVPGWTWSEPATVFHDPAFTIPSGGGFNFTCDYENTGMTDVKFGESANDEMCFFWAYYYPSKGTKVCVHTSKAGGLDFCCPGSTYCGLLGK